MRLPSEGIGKVCPGLRRQLADHGFGEGTATHVAQGRTIDNVVGVSGAQEIEEVFNRLLLARVPNHLKRGGQSAPIGNAASRNHRDRGDGIDHSRHKSHRASRGARMAASIASLCDDDIGVCSGSLPGLGKRLHLADDLAAGVLCAAAVRALP